MEYGDNMSGILPGHDLVFCKKEYCRESPDSCHHMHNYVQEWRLSTDKASCSLGMVKFGVCCWCAYERYYTEEDDDL
jgi:hypothetical protein